jgi:hypothetical protein
VESGQQYSLYCQLKEDQIAQDWLAHATMPVMAILNEESDLWVDVIVMAVFASRTWVLFVFSCGRRATSLLLTPGTAHGSGHSTFSGMASIQYYTLSAALREA